MSRTLPELRRGKSTVLTPVTLAIDPAGSRPLAVGAIRKGVASY
jgi:hypothetical protein